MALDASEGSVLASDLEAITWFFPTASCKPKEGLASVTSAEPGSFWCCQPSGVLSAVVSRKVHAARRAQASAMHCFSPSATL